MQGGGALDESEGRVKPTISAEAWAAWKIAALVTVVVAATILAMAWIAGR